MTNITTVGGNLAHAALHGVIVFIALYGATLFTFVPHGIADVSVASLVTFIISWAQRSISVPAGSSIVKPVKV